MTTVFIIISVLFILGGIGTVLHNRILNSEGRKENWIKFVFYFIIVFTVISSILIDRKIFAALIILISSLGLIEMMDVSNKSNPTDKRKRILLVSLLIFNLIFALFTFFILLPEKLIIYTYTLVMTFDGGGQIFGRLLGKRKITPVISPNKTWGGFLYGSLLTILISWLLKDLASFEWWQSLLFGTIVSLSAFSGDIMASAFKRTFGAKNYSNHLPGQGGMFDRFDSFLMTGAVIGLFGMPLLFSNPWDKDVLLYLAMTNLFLFILILGEFFYFYLKVKSEFSRMIAHIMAGLVSLLLINKFSSEYYVVALCIQSAIFLFLTAKMGFLKSHHDVVRKTDGSPLFFVGILAAYFISVFTSEKWLFILPLVILTFCDPLAAFAGMKIKSRRWKSFGSAQKSPKTYSGTIAFFISASLFLLWGLPYYFGSFTMPALVMSVIFIALIVSLIELITSGGYDNLTIPATIILLMILSKYLQSSLLFG